MLHAADICLGPILQSDALALFAWRNSPEVMHLDGLYRPVSQQAFDDWFGAIGRSEASVVFAIRTIHSAELLGYVEVMRIHPVFRSAELSILIGAPDQRGRGHGRTALRLCMEFCWQELNLRRLSLSLLASNTRARRTYEAVGFRLEGVLREAVFSDGGFCDVLMLACLRSELPDASGQTAV